MFAIKKVKKYVIMAVALGLVELALTAQILFRGRVQVGHLNQILDGTDVLFVINSLTCWIPTIRFYITKLFFRNKKENSDKNVDFCEWF